MRLHLLFSALAVIVLAATLNGTVKPASAETVLTAELIERVKTQCVENQAALNRLHQTDAFLRNDRGDLYRTISDKLMVPFNQRLVSNQLDGSTMISITADYNEEYTKFYNAYIAYDNALTKLQKVDCQKEPVTFYNQLLDARDKRQKLSKTNQKLIALILQYKNEFRVFHQDFLKKEQVTNG